MKEREQIERAIAALEAQRASLGDEVVETALAPLLAKLSTMQVEPFQGLAMSPAQKAGEQRKFVTVLFADVSGFTAMSEQMDAEEVNSVMNALWKRLDRAISEHGGWIDKHIGDAVMALWGAVTAREDDPEQAIQAALEMQRQLADIGMQVSSQDASTPSFPSQIHMRIGIHSGPVFLSKIGSTGEYSAIGDTVNTASRLEHAAPLDGVLISQDTYRLIRGNFNIQPLDSIRVKGKINSLPVFLVLGAKEHSFHSRMRGIEGLTTRMIGRQAELRQLQQVLQDCTHSGHLRMVTIVAEAGAGKSRLLYEFEDWVEFLPQPFNYFKGRAGSEMQAIPYALARDVFVFRFQIQESDPVQTVYEKMEAGFGEVLGSGKQAQAKAHIVGQLLGFDFSNSPHVKNILNDAQQIQDRGRFYLQEYFQAFSQLGSSDNTPTTTLILLEDLHWADDSSLDLFNFLAKALSEQPIMIIGTARPSFLEDCPQWGRQVSNYSRLDLTLLSDSDSHCLVVELLQKVEDTPAALSKLVIENAEGNPFYIEELVKMLIEDGVIIQGEERWQVLPERLPTLRVPNTLTAVLQARLDNLPRPVKEMLQRGSVIGRSFWDNAVAFLEAETEDASRLKPILELSCGKELVFRQPKSIFVDAGEYAFKHALLRDVTYESVLKRERPLYHARAAHWLIQHSSDRPGEYASLIAGHLEMAGQGYRAVEYLQQAGQQAGRRYANVEAVAYYTRALNLLPDNHPLERFELLLAREKIYQITGQHEAESQDLAALLELSESSGDSYWRAEASLRKVYFCNSTDDYPSSISAAEETVRLAQEAQKPELAAEAKIMWGSALLFQGKIEAAQMHLLQALELAAQTGAPRLQAEALHRLSVIETQQSKFDQSRAYQEQALTIYRQMGDRRGEARVINNMGILAFYRGEYQQAQTYWEQGQSFFHEIGDRYDEALSINNIGNVAWHAANLDSARQYFEQALGLFRQAGSKEGECLALTNLGGIFMDQKDYGSALHIVEQSLQICREIGDLHKQGLALHSLADVYLFLGMYGKAREYAENALKVRRQVADHIHISLVLSLLARIYIYTEEYENALLVSQEALQIAEELQATYEKGYALTCLGQAYYHAGRLEQAAEVFKQAIDAQRQNQELPGDSLAGLVQTELAMGNMKQLRQDTRQLLSLLSDSRSNASKEIINNHLICYQALRAANNKRAPQVLSNAFHLLSRQTALISDPEQRRSLLESVPFNREVIRLATQAGLAKTLP